ncbi:thymidine phosphorylase, partial [Escherichia coli]|nr:thymidine phosphorylase [Escherichia coli]
DGYVTDVDAYAMGVAAWRLGAGRARKEDPVSVPAGVLLHKRPGDPVRVGDPLYELRAERSELLPAALAEAARGLAIADRPPAAVPLVIDRVE